MHRPSPTSKAIVSAQQWDMLDFEDVDEELANKLTDDDIYSILKSINAQDMLKRLKLCGCVNITGIGLHPLQGSVVLEQIDISLIRKYEKPSYNKPQSKISEDVVVPILDSIISADGCSIKYIQFPMKWRAIGMNGIEDNPLMVLQRNFNALLGNRTYRGVNCIHCAVRIHPVQAQNWYRILDNMMLCYDCLAGPICRNCQNNNLMLVCCAICKKKYCEDCNTVTFCSSCPDCQCDGCGGMEACDECNRANCEDCLNTCDGCNRTRCEGCSTYRHCDECPKSHCSDCYDGEEYDVKVCEECGNTCCSDCTFDIVKEDAMGACSGCLAVVEPSLYEALLQEELNRLSESECQEDSDSERSYQL